MYVLGNEAFFLSEKFEPCPTSIWEPRILVVINHFVGPPPSGPLYAIAQAAHALLDAGVSEIYDRTYENLQRRSQITVCGSFFCGRLVARPQIH